VGDGEDGEHGEDEENGEMGRWGDGEDEENGENEGGLQVTLTLPHTTFPMQQSEMVILPTTDGVVGIGGESRTNDMGGCAWSCGGGEWWGGGE